MTTRLRVDGCSHKGQDASYSTIHGKGDCDTYWGGSRNGRILNKLVKSYMDKEAVTACSQ